MPTHGSLTKAGKVRGQTPKVEGRKRVGTTSSLRNKSNFKKRFIFGKISWSKQTRPKTKTSLIIFIDLNTCVNKIKEYLYNVLVPYLTV